VSLSPVLFVVETPLQKRDTYFEMCQSEFRRESRHCDVHAACQDRECSVETIHRFIDAAGVEILQQKDVYGRVPLYYAIRNHCSLPLIRTLFDTSPNAIFERDFCGELPLYMLFRPQADIRILEYVLERNPWLAFFKEKRFSGTQSLLQNLCAQWIHVVRKHTATNSMSLDSLSSIDHNDNGESNVRDVFLTRDMICSDCALLDRWNKLALTARAAHFVSHKTTASSTANKSTFEILSDVDALKRHETLRRKTPELHIALQLESMPSAVLCQFVEMYPEQASLKLSTSTIRKKQHEIDSNKCANSTYIGESATTSRDSTTSDESSSSSTTMANILPLHFFLSNFSGTKTRTPNKIHRAAFVRSLSCQDFGSILKSLVHAFPLAASIRHSRVVGEPESRPTSLPLHTAIATSSLSWEEGLRELVYAHPSALDINDGFGTRMVPFLQQTAIASARRSDNQDSNETKTLTTAYCLLREDPSVLSRMVTSLGGCEKRSAYHN